MVLILYISTAWKDYPLDLNPLIPLLDWSDFLLTELYESSYGFCLQVLAML